MSYTNAQVNARFAALEAKLDALISAQAPVQAPAPAQAAPATAKVESQFVTDMRARAAAKVACELHPAAICTRTFSPNSTGRGNHLARIK